jgi:hypothetical protein
MTDRVACFQAAVELRLDRLFTPRHRATQQQVVADVFEVCVRGVNLHRGARSNIRMVDRDHEGDGRKIRARVSSDCRESSSTQRRHLNPQKGVDR